MSDIEPLFREMIDTLSQAQLAVQTELDLLVGSQSHDIESLWRLNKSVGEFSSEADGLLVMMLEQQAPGNLIDTAQTLVDFFREAKKQIASLLKAGRG
jgi:hypothetical protein